MEKNLNQPQIEELLPRYCAGMATNEECAAVEAWMSESVAHEELVKEMHTLNLALDTISLLPRIDTEKALRKVKERMSYPRTKTAWEWMQRVAAILFIPLLVALLIQQLHGNSEQEVVQLIEVKSNSGMTTSVVLPDSTVVFLNAESSLQYPSRFEGDTRAVRLTGEAYFEVAKDARRRFVVSTLHQVQIEVLGTRFNVEAYAERETIVTTLVEGAVDFLVTCDRRQQRVALKPAQKLIYDVNRNRLQLQETSCLSETAWKDGTTIFANTPLQDALHTLEKRFGVRFVVKNKRLFDNRFTGTFTHQRLECILNFFKISSNINWRDVEPAALQHERSLIEIY